MLQDSVFYNMIASVIRIVHQAFLAFSRAGEEFLPMRSVSLYKFEKGCMLTEEQFLYIFNFALELVENTVLIHICVLDLLCRKINRVVRAAGKPRFGRFFSRLCMANLNLKGTTFFYTPAVVLIIHIPLLIFNTYIQKMPNIIFTTILHFEVRTNCQIVVARRDGFSLGDRIFSFVFEIKQ